MFIKLILDSTECTKFWRILTLCISFYFYKLYLGFNRYPAFNFFHHFDYMGAKNFPKFRYPKYTQRNFLPRTLPLCQEPNALGAISLNVRIWNYRQRSVCDFIHSYFLSDFSVHLFKETGKYFG